MHDKFRVLFLNTIKFISCLSLTYLNLRFLDRVSFRPKLREFLRFRRVLEEWAHSDCWILRQRALSLHFWTSVLVMLRLLSVVNCLVNELLILHFNHFLSFLYFCKIILEIRLSTVLRLGKQLSTWLHALQTVLMVLWEAILLLHEAVQVLHVGSEFWAWIVYRIEQVVVAICYRIAFKIILQGLRKLGRQYESALRICFLVLDWSLKTRRWLRNGRKICW